MWTGTGNGHIHAGMSAACYCTLLRKATRRLSGVYDEALAPLGINIAQYALLRMVAARGSLSLTELGRIAELDRSTIGRNVRVLERMGLMRTGRSADDHRESMVTLTAPGSDLLARARPVWDACQARIEARLGPQKVEALGAILAAL